jgi:radical SAM-linked protein
MRVRITFSKTGALRYIGNLDLHALWERSARRANLPLAYTHGYHPQPKIYLASALPLGFSSRCEVVDLRLNQDLELAELPERLKAVIPSGIGILKVEVVEEQAPALQTLVIAAEYEVTIKRNPGSLGEETLFRTGLVRQTEDLLARSTLPRSRRGKAYDLRPLIEQLTVISENKVFMRLTSREGATGRPEEILDELGIELENTQIERINLIFQG